MGQNKSLRLTLSRETIKYLAIVIMTLDHIAEIVIFPLTADHTLSASWAPWGNVFAAISGFAGMVMIYFLCEGFYYTRDLVRYGKRLLLFGLVSQSCYGFAFDTSLGNMILSLFLCFLTLYVHTYVGDRWRRYLLYGILILLSGFSDWTLLSVPFTLFLMPAFPPVRETEGQTASGKKKVTTGGKTLLTSLVKCILWYGLLDGIVYGKDLWQKGILGLAAGALVILVFYQGTRQEKHQVFHKYFFYIFYPTHLVLLKLIYLLIRGAA